MKGCGWWAACVLPHPEACCALAGTPGRQDLQDRGSERARLPSYQLGARGRAAVRTHSLSFPIVNPALGVHEPGVSRNEERELVTPGVLAPAWNSA